MKKEIFVSFSNKDREKTDKIVDALEKLGVTCWYQSNDSKGRFSHEIVNGIKEAKYFIACLSNNSMASTIIQNEINLGVDKYTEVEIKRRRAAREGNSKFMEDIQEYKILPIELEPLEDDYREEAGLFLKIFNWLFYSEYENEMLLAMAICKQLGISNDLIRESSYSAILPLEKQRLEYQARVLASQMRPVLLQICAKLDKPKVLDVGCADGTATLLKFEGIPMGDYVGLDHEFDEKWMHTRYESQDDVAFIEADLQNEEYVDVLKTTMEKRGIDAFDIIHISFVMLHIKDCVGVLQSLKQFLAPQGYIIIQDIDDDQTMVYPESRFFADWKLIWEDSSETGDRKMGRKLPIFLKKAGYRNIHLERDSMDSFSLDEDCKKAFWDMLYNPKYWVVSESDFVNYDTYMKLGKYRRDYDKYLKQFEKDEVFISQGIFIVTAQV